MPKPILARSTWGMPMTPDEFGKMIAEDTKKWAKVIRAANIKPE